MDSSTIIGIAIAVAVALAVLVLFTTAKRRDVGRLSGETIRKDRSDSPFLPEVKPPSGRDVERMAKEARQPGKDIEKADDAAPAPYVPVDPETIGFTRRQFFNRSMVGMMGFGLAGFGASVLAFLWPQLSGGFGTKITVGKLDEILGEIRDGRQPKYVSSGRFYLSTFPAEAIAKAEAAYSPAVLPGMEQGIVALYQKCPHLGCRVPFCQTSQWFECGCHGSKYNRVGEKKAGPAPRGMDLFPVEVNGATVTVDTGVVIQGMAIGTNTTGQEAEGPACVGGGH